MRLSKGAGTSELLGLASVTKRKEYSVIRPLLQYSKDELENYLKKNKYHYFVDASNSDEKYERNRFRNQFSNKLIAEYKEGIKRSFDYLAKDKAVLVEGVEVLFHEKELYLLAYQHEHQIVRLVDQYLKQLGYLLSGQQRKALEKEKSIVFGATWAVEILDERIFIAPYRKGAMPKAFKEACRKAKIPSKIRSYLHEEQIAFKKMLAAF
jgi:tRNA(Ile)-lysidine synthase